MQIHLEEVDIKLPIDVMELVSVLLERMLLVDLAEILQIVGALLVDTLVDAKAGTLLDRHESMTAIGALVFHRLGVDAAADEGGAADLALILAMATIVIVEVIVGSTADGTDLVLGDSIAAPAADRLELFAIAMLVVGKEELPVLLEEGNDGR